MTDTPDTAHDTPEAREPDDTISAADATTHRVMRLLR
jgi:hypothetical protein